MFVHFLGEVFLFRDLLTFIVLPWRWHLPLIIILGSVVRTVTFQIESYLNNLDNKKLQNFWKIAVKVDHSALSTYDYIVQTIV